MRIRTKLIGLMVLYLCISAIFLGFYRTIETSRLKLILDEEMRARTYSFKHVLALLENSLETYVYDYTYWDEMVSFVSSEDKTWAKENIDTSLKTYKANVAWVIKTDGSIIYAVSNLDLASGAPPFPLPKGAIDKFFSNTRFCHFFLNTPGGIMEIRGATIHPSNDEKRMMPPVGYYMVGRLWDQAYLDNLGTSAAASITTYLTKNIAYVPTSDIRKGTIAFFEILKDWEGKPLAIISMQSESSQITNALKLAQWTMFSIVIYSIILFLALLVSLIIWVERPLSLISLSIATSDTAPIEDIINKKNEFGKIAAMIAKFTEQKNSLESEIRERRRAEKDLKDRVQDMEVFHKVAIDRELKMTELKEEISELKEELEKRKRL